MNRPPIFIHSLFRAGSTYLFNVFRRSPAGYWCYQEPLHEIAVFHRNEPARLLEGFGERETVLNRHPPIGKPYFQELHDTWPAWKDALTESAVYSAYFAPPGMDIGIDYWRALIEAARGRPVFQECRTASRIAAIKDRLGGCHIYLWRNPWDQWWSHKATPYFDIANQLIVNAVQAPGPVVALRRAIDFEASDDQDIAHAFSYFESRPLPATKSYLLFYLLWCLALRHGTEHAHHAINIDRLTESSAYRAEVRDGLARSGIGGLDFTDCRVFQGVHTKRCEGFFRPLEEKVHDLLMEGGWARDELDGILDLRGRFQPANSTSTGVAAVMTEQTARALGLARRYEDRVAEVARNWLARGSEAEARAVEAEERWAVAQDRARKEEAKARHAEARAAAAEAKAGEAQAALRAVYDSHSWRLTSPIRWVSTLLRGVAHNAGELSRRLFTAAFGEIVRVTCSRPWIRNNVLPLIKRRPGLEARLRRLGAVPAHTAGMLNAPRRLSDLSFRAREIHGMLKAAMERGRARGP